MKLTREQRLFGAFMCDMILGVGLALVAMGSIQAYMPRSSLRLGLCLLVTFSVGFTVSHIVRRPLLRLWGVESTNRR